MHEERRREIRYATTVICRINLANTTNETLHAVLMDISQNGGRLVCECGVMNSQNVTITFEGLEQYPVTARLIRANLGWIAKTCVAAIQVPGGWPYQVFSALAFPDSSMLVHQQDDPYADMFR